MFFFSKKGSFFQVFLSTTTSVLTYFTRNFFLIAFVQLVSGISFTFDPQRPPYSRVIPDLVQVADEWIDVKQNYSLCVKSYMHGGCDGFTMFKDAKIIVSNNDSKIQEHFSTSL